MSSTSPDTSEKAQRLLDAAGLKRVPKERRQQLRSEFARIVSGDPTATLSAQVGPSENTKEESTPGSPFSYTQTPVQGQRKDTGDKSTKTAISEMSKPVLFYGKPSQLPQVLTFATVKFIADGITDDTAKSGYLASLFRGSALTWLTRELEQNPHLLSDWEDFHQKVTEAFDIDPEAKKAQAARQLAQLRQKGSAQDYGLRFQQLAQAAELPSATAIAFFTKGLKRHIRQALIINDERDTLQDAIKESARIDSQLYYAAPRFSGQGSQQGKRRDHKGRFKKSHDTVKAETFDY